MFEALPFDHPLWIVYSSGTTGTPKAIVHGHGGAALVGLKDTRLQLDVAPGDRFHWYSSSGWIMWNSQVAALLVGATVCIYDGNAGWPDWNTLWRFAEERQIAFFGAGAAFYASCLKAGIEPGRDFDLSKLQSLGSTGSPLSDDAYRWIYGHVKEDVWLGPISGGTDLAAAFICGSVTLPVRASIRLTSLVSSIATKIAPSPSTAADSGLPRNATVATNWSRVASTTLALWLRPLKAIRRDAAS